VCSLLRPEQRRAAHLLAQVHTARHLRLSCTLRVPIVCKWKLRNGDLSSD
jgi:hypothetical protein